MSLSSILTFAAAAIVSLSPPDKNLITNGCLETDRSDIPPVCWIATSSESGLEYKLSGGPEDKGYLRIANLADAPINGERVVRQNNLTLVAGAKYRMSAWIRTENFVSSNAGVVIANFGWKQCVGFTGLPENSDWTHYEEEVIIPETEKAGYAAILYACNFKGAVEITDIQLEALDQAAKDGSKPTDARDAYDRFTLIPWKPLLCQIDSADRKLVLRLYGKKDRALLKDLEIAVRLSDLPETKTTPLVFPAKLGKNAIVLPEHARSGEIFFSLRNRVTGETLLTNAAPYAVVGIPKVDATQHRRLNNLSVEILNQPLESTPKRQFLPFSTVRSGWIFVSARDTGVAPDLKILLDGRTTILDANTPRGETFREIPVGDHTLVVSGAVHGGSIVARAITETLNYCPGKDSCVPENPPYDWEFQKKYGLPSVTTQNGGDIPEKHRAWFHAQGYKWLANLNSAFPATPQVITQKYNEAAGMTVEYYDGVTADEHFFSQPGFLANYTNGLKAYANPLDRLIYTWIVGKPGNNAIDHEFLATCVNASHGRGKVIHEAYCLSKATEKEARAYLDDYIKDTVVKFKDAYPGIAPSMGMILGDFNQLPIISLHHHPEVDYKYFLDMQWHLLANDPELKDIGCVGYWGSYYADHEMHRWALQLMRHYVVEGKKNMLSDEYGFSYIPGHLKNGDFADGMDPWIATGNVSNDKIPGYADASQHRWGGNNGVGDTFALFAKTGNEISTVTQTAKKLVPGKKYLLQFLTFDADDARAKRIDPRDFGIRATIDPASAEVIPELSWQYIDRREEGSYYNQNAGAHLNLHHIVFTAKATEAKITIDNRLAKPGENLAVNFVSLTPFFEE